MRSHKIKINQDDFCRKEMKKSVLYVELVMSSVYKRAKSFLSIESEPKIKTESMILPIRQMPDRKFHHRTFCDDKTKCPPPHWYLQHVINWL